jgi:hypothetical protein
MNILTIILNRVYHFLIKTKNQSPFLGTIILVALLLNTLTYFLIMSIGIVNNKGGILYYSIWGIITLLVYLYARKKKYQIKEVKLSTKKSILVAGIFLFTLISFIWCASINRAKLSKQNSNILEKIQKESLERKIRKLFE